MTTAFALERIPRWMKELGYGDNYMLKYRHFSLYAGETRTVDAYSEYFFLLDAESEISASSEFGVYDLGDTTINEQQYEHQGKIILCNKAITGKQIKFIQVIPKHISSCHS